MIGCVNRTVEDRKKHTLRHTHTHATPVTKKVVDGCYLL
jgi:hypothetical protein